MRDSLGKSLRNLKWIKIRKSRISAVLLALSLVVSLGVFWGLRQPGLTLAGDADCGILEHTHDDACHTQGTTCLYEEHTHSITCYADETENVETMLDWQKMFADYPYTGNLREDLVGIAQTQVGYSESTRNFEVGQDGVRRGYTRYSAWYGTPYRDWSAMFVSFCLSYAKADPEEFPGNTGAAAMAELWNKLGKYEPVGDYVPVSGDLVFFTNNTVGIVAAVKNATFYVIRGDMEDAVRGEILSLADESIAGWGLTEETEPPPGDGAEKATDDLAPDKQAPPDAEDEDGAATLTLKNSAATSVELIPTYFSLLDKDDQKLGMEGQNYLAYLGTIYHLTARFSNEAGFTAGTYHYQLPAGLVVVGKTAGEFKLLRNDAVVGEWTLAEIDGQLTLSMVFYDNIKSYPNITISTPTEIRFAEEGTVDFAGNEPFTVTVQEPPADGLTSTVLEKWIDETKLTENANKLPWKVHLVGRADSDIPGNTISDRLLSGSDLGVHKYTQADMNAGINVGVGHYNPETGQNFWWAWTVKPGDPNLIWTEDQWIYTIPEQVVAYGQTVTLGNEGWEYYFEYSSTPMDEGSQAYMNRVTVDGQVREVWYYFTYHITEAEVNKTGTFLGEADGGAFYWELQVTLPGMEAGKKAEKGWYLQDYMEVVSTSLNVVDHITNDANKSSVTANYKGATINVPHILYATETEPFAWDNSWSPDYDGVYYGRQLELLHLCDCTAETCAAWGESGCTTKHWFEVDGKGYIKNYCTCWTATEAATFTFAYRTTDLSLTQTYGKLGYTLRNRADLYMKSDGPGANDWGAVWMGSTATSVVIPELLSKERIREFDGAPAQYRITVNEAKMALPSGTPLTIRDEMSTTMVFVNGSMKITAQDALGNTTVLRQGEDFTVTYHGEGEQLGTDGKPEHQIGINGEPVHIVEIQILHPQPMTYTLDYETALLIEAGTSEDIRYTNTAVLEIWDKELTATISDKYFADINIAADGYEVRLHKIESLEGNPLGGAKFGLFSEHGGLIATEETDGLGNLVIKTDILAGIYLQPHTLYYMQEQEAPPGYQLDDTKHWLCFCDSASGSCAACDALTAEKTAICIPFGQAGPIEAVNELQYYDLPETGGPGIYPMILAGVILIITSLVYGTIRRRKRERRGVG